MRRALDRDGGTTSIELVLVAPIFLAALMLVVGLGRIVEAEGRVQGAARDAARAASISRTAVLAQDAARKAAAADLTEQGVSCSTFDVTVETTGFSPGGSVSVSVACVADLSGLTFAGLPGSKRLRAQATAPLERYRGVG